MIEFIEHKDPGYASRTLTNAKEANLTIAFAADFKTGGEILTRNLVNAYGNKYLAVDIFKIDMVKLEENLRRLHIFDGYRLNIAGNGLYTLIDYLIAQEDIDKIVKEVLEDLFFIPDILSVQTGGQTGADEAGIKFAKDYNITIIKCIAPRGWLFRDINGNDIADEQLFKERFKS